ncbi:MAG TPA: exosortase-associated EpsI family protein [Tepidisphaeraceae bacterium]|jgi:hypothetical protein|nr:exosortase-associated EpsI family protein [Tepidisphaeraceae bacterium]
MANVKVEFREEASGVESNPAPVRVRKGNSGKLSFIIVIVVLGLAAVGLNGATSFMKLYFKKLPVELSMPLVEIPAQLGSWKQMGVDRPMAADIEHVLGTDKYVFRTYADMRVLKPEWVQGLAEADLDTDAEAQQKIGRLRAEYPAAFINMAVTYYTGMVDTVAHIPDRCYVADGYEPTTEPEVLTWDVKPHDPVTVRYINFEDQTPRGAENKNVAYFFQVNGAYECDPITGVRLRLQDLRERHGYYAKIEMMNQLKDQSVAKKAMADFLGASLPDIEKCLPDWKKVKAEEQVKK